MRGSPGDGEKAPSLLEETLPKTQEVGMVPLEGRTQKLLESMDEPAEE